MITKKITFCFALLLVFSVVSNGQTVKLKITVTNSFPVGWGIIYKGKIDKVLEGNQQLFTDTIEFGITASKKFEYLKSGDSKIITFTNSKEKNKNTYLPAINGAVSKKKEIWIISNIE